MLVVSCDSYSDVWPFFFRSLFNSWPKCPLDIYLISNKKNYKSDKIKNIRVGKDVSWSDNLIKALEKVRKDYILLMIDDLLVNKKISNNYFKEINNWLNNHKPDYLRLHISSKPLKYDELIGIIPNKSPYKTSTMPCIWKKTELKKLLKEGESAWEFEKFGSIRAYNNKNFFSVYDNFIDYDNAIIKGKWERSVALKFEIYDDTRNIMNIFEKLIYDFKIFRSKIFNILPNQLKLIFKQ